MDLETLQQSCRVCLRKGDINIWEFKVQLTNPTLEQECNSDIDADSNYVNTLDLMDIFSNTVSYQ